MIPQTLNTSSNRIIDEGRASPPPKVKVFARWRSPNQCPSIIDNPSSSTITVKSTLSTQYQFDRVFSAKATQRDVYEVVGRPIIEEFLNGQNAAVLAYGQSGTGKTYSLHGESSIYDPVRRGIVPRLIEDLFKRLVDSRKSFSITLSVCEIYCEKINDLLEKNDENSSNPSGKKLQLRESSGGYVYVEGMIERSVQTACDLLSQYEQACVKRSVGETALNSKSSRSHQISIVTLASSPGLSGGPVMSRRLFFVDLAGSERAKKASGCLEEGRMINKSLTTLGNVVGALIRGQSFVPYRDSKLTRLLQCAFGGESLTHVLCTLSGAVENEVETCSTLYFGSRTGSIVNRVPTIHESDQSGNVSSANLIQSLKEEVVKLQRELARYVRESSASHRQINERRGLDWASSSSSSGVSRDASEAREDLYSLEDSNVISEGNERDLDENLAEARTNLEATLSFSSDGSGDRFDNFGGGDPHHHGHSGELPPSGLVPFEAWNPDNEVGDLVEQGQYSSVMSIILTQHRKLAEKYARNRVKEIQLKSELKAAYKRIGQLSSIINSMELYGKQSEDVSTASRKT